MRRFPPSPSLERKVERVNARVEIVIACEGLVTEPKYILDCAKYYGSGMVVVRVLDKTGVPLTVVRAAIQERKKLLAKYRKQKELGPVDGCFRVWAIFDKDDHDVDEALALAKEHKVCVAFSNPCFELWPILHLVDYGAQDDRHILQKLLNQHMPTYNHQSSPNIDFDSIKEHFDIAYQRACLLNQSRDAEGCTSGRPSTTVGELVIKIQQNGKVAARRAAANR
ncbi:RloB family protein [Dyella caseinilytica]|uniref:RloB domain-containing protein n=1 Tax=Dyella caseinilytica TaxID=1849581 RepID=A0ABX7GWH1_9GAMM|nr:RloB family protein [Dyella caseinilytica]QRN54752.1 RloB domain-containing protein [Dyella caseinilytica]GFZ96612.1 hypothetical protein GCM10011408_16250 [Dyella caseinilytica]